MNCPFKRTENNCSYPPKLGPPTLPILCDNRFDGCDPDGLSPGSSSFSIFLASLESAETFSVTLIQKIKYTMYVMQCLCSLFETFVKQFTHRESYMMWCILTCLYGLCYDVLAADHQMWYV